MPEFRTQLLIALNEQKFTQKRLALTINTEPQLVGKWCRGAVVPSLKHFRAICVALHISADKLLGLE